MDKRDTKQVLITGGAGYVGQVLLDGLPNNWKATVIDNVYGGNNNFHPSENIEFFCCILATVSINMTISKNGFFFAFFYQF